MDLPLRNGLSLAPNILFAIRARVMEEDANVDGTLSSPERNHVVDIALICSIPRRRRRLFYSRAIVETTDIERSSFLASNSATCSVVCRDGERQVRISTTVRSALPAVIPSRRCKRPQNGFVGVLKTPERNVIAECLDGPQRQKSSAEDRFHQDSHGNFETEKS